MSFKIISNRKPFVYALDNAALGLRLTSEGFYMAVTESNDHTWVIGPEIEYNFDPSPRLVRLSVTRLERYTNSFFSNPYEIFEFFVRELNEKLTFAEKVEDDQERNLEIVLKPSSKAALKIQFTRICELAIRMRDYGFDANDLRAGIHLNVHPLNWGNTWETRINVFRKFAYFCFSNRDIVNNISGRKKGTQKFSDIQHALGDPMGQLNEQLLYDRFQREIDSFIKRWRENLVAEFCNIIANKARRTVPGVLEFRWFSSSDNVEIMMSYVEFLEACILFCASNTELRALTLENFVVYVKSYKNKFPNLLSELSDKD